jgi:hypothetical protein
VSGCHLEQVDDESAGVEVFDRYPSGGIATLDQVGPGTKAVTARATPLEIFILAACLWLLIGPRITLISFAGSSVRLEDGVLAALASITAIHWTRQRRAKVGPTGIAWVTLTTFAACVLGIITSHIDAGAGILYALRPLEYWFILPCVVFVLGGERFESRMRWLVRLLATITIAQVGVAALQYLGGSSFGFSKFSYDRGAGLAAGPYELGALCAILACFWLGRRNYGLFIVSIAGIAMSQSRISMAAIVAAVFILLIAQSRARRPHPGLTKGSDARSHQAALALSAVLVTLTTVGLILFSSQITTQLVLPALGRLESTSIFTTWGNAGMLASSVPHVQNSAEYIQIAYGGIYNVLQDTTASDASNLVRFYRWHILLNSMSYPGDLLLGLGPSFPGPSVDGAFLRIFVESGLFGVVAWLAMFRNWLRGTQVWFVAAVLTLLIGSTFIDLLFALRPMVLLWILYAVARLEPRTGRSGADKTPDLVYLSIAGKTQ